MSKNVLPYRYTNNRTKKRVQQQERGRNATNVSCVVPKSNFKNKRLLRWNSHFIANRRSVQLHHSLLVVKFRRKKKQSGDSKETRKPKTTNSNMLIKRREKQRNCLLVIILPNVCEQTELTHTSAELYCYSAEKRNILKLKRCVTWKVYNQCLPPSNLTTIKHRKDVRNGTECFSGLFYLPIFSTLFINIFFIVFVYVLLLFICFIYSSRSNGIEIYLTLFSSTKVLFFCLLNQFVRFPPSRPTLTSSCVECVPYFGYNQNLQTVCNRNVPFSEVLSYFEYNRDDKSRCLIVLHTPKLSNFQNLLTFLTKLTP